MRIFDIYYRIGVVAVIVCYVCISFILLYSMCDKVSEVNKFDKIAILINCMDRVEVFNKSLDTLTKVHNIDKISQVFIIQDGFNENVSNLVSSYSDKLNVIHIQHQQEKRELKTNYELIAKHFKYALNTVFAASSVEYVIILEDDLFYSPDLLDYFVFMIDYLENGNKTFCISAWNDNGSTKVTSNKNTVRQTSFFPGLGWMINRKTWNGFLKKYWPNKDWDWFIRRIMFTNDWNCYYPEISRTFHAGINGTFMSDGLHNAYFKNQNLFTGNIPVKYNVLDYDLYLKKMLTESLHIRDLTELYNSDSDRVIWISINPDKPVEINAYRKFADHFHIWDDIRRASFHNVVEISLGGHQMFIVNVFNDDRWAVCLKTNTRLFKYIEIGNYSCLKHI